MTPPHLWQDWNEVRRKIANGPSTAYDLDREKWLRNLLIGPAIYRAVQDAQPQIDAAIAKRRAVARWRAQQTQPRRR